MLIQRVTSWTRPPLATKCLKPKGSKMYRSSREEGTHDRRRCRDDDQECAPRGGIHGSIAGDAGISCLRRRCAGRSDPRERSGPDGLGAGLSERWWKTELLRFIRGVPGRFAQRRAHQQLKVTRPPPSWTCNVQSGELGNPCHTDAL